MTDGRRTRGNERGGLGDAGRVPRVMAIAEALAAMPPGALAGFALAGLAVNLAPGPDVLLATAFGVQGGPRAGALAGLGVGFGVLGHVALAGAGIAALIAAHPAALTGLRLAGAAVLAWLAWGAWRAAGPAAVAAPAAPAVVRAPAGAAAILAKGCLTNALNPKVLLFMVAFLPPFADPARGPVGPQIVGLGLIFAATGTAITVGYGVLAGLAGRRLGGRMRALNRVAAAIYAGLALRLLASP